MHKKCNWITRHLNCISQKKKDKKITKSITQTNHLIIPGNATNTKIKIKVLIKSP